MNERFVWQIAAACGGGIINCEINRTVNSFCINHGDCKQGSCFIAMKGEHDDGNNYARQAIEKGASVILSDGECDMPFPYIKVNDVREALIELGRYYRNRDIGTVIAVTGSVGKTTVREMCASVISQRERVLKTEGNQNTLIGVPLTVMRWDGETCAVLELGISEKGEMERLSYIACPDIAVITNIGSMHADTLGSSEQIAAEKIKILEYAKKDCVLITAYQNGVKHENAVTVGIDDRAEYFASNIMYTANGTFFDANVKNGRVCKRLFVPMIGEHAALDAMFAFALGDLMKISDEKIRKGLCEYKSVGDRQNITEVGGVSIMRDCYNFGPESGRASLEAFSKFCALRAVKKSAVMLGDMLELGDMAESEHINIGRLVARFGFDVLITVGPLSQNIALGALMRGMPPNNIFCYSFEEREQAKEKVKEMLCEGDALLIKGSRAMRMEELSPF